MLEYMTRHLSGHGPLAGPDVPWQIWVLLFVAVTIGNTVHEFGHAWMADRLGDPGPRAQGRVSLNPLRHIDPLGMVLMAVTMLIGFPIGWGKSVKPDPDKFTCGRRKGMALVAAAGPLMNLATAFALAPIARAALGTGLGEEIPLAVLALLAVLLTMLINLSQFVFNLVPIHPMDGAHVLTALLPEKAAEKYVAFMGRYGVYVFLALMATGWLGDVLAPLVLKLFFWLIGIG
jgi:Zn-dependent protease